MDSNKDFERNRQKMNIKELNGMDTTNEQANELMMALSEFLKTTPTEKIRSLIEESDREDAIIDMVLGESKALPLASIEKLLPFIEVLHARVIKSPKDKDTRNLLNHACDTLATYSHRLVPEGTHIASDNTYTLSDDEIETMTKETLLEKWNLCFMGVIGQVKEDLKSKDNISLCGHCYHLWDLSNISAIFF